MYSGPHPLWLTAILAAFLLATPPAWAAVPEVRDQTRLFRPETVEQADAILQDIKRVHNQELAIETYSSIPADRQAAWQAESNDPEKRTLFFAEWGRERFRALNVNGIYMLITKDPDHLQIEVGNVTVGRAFTMENRDRVDKIMVPRLERKDYDDALLAGVEYVRRAMNENLSGSAPPAVPGASASAEHPSWFPGLGVLSWLCIGLIGVAAIAGVFLAIRALRGPRRAASPGGPGRVPS